ncbi:hypothetical protein FUAX_52760 (plasmid) [Fulvitalea axinellae]|uniref:LamG-like jellyroll fold domain-containing protein n=1 Tax=Fulvitalea axinellae TaxID=1182444 RepID=A0AAU9DEH9_9BACT|nr:hypothetical protein FUAX_52760 [Fulvitalea axinellae]
MRNIFLFCLVVTVIIFGGGQLRAQSSLLEEGLIGHYPLDGDAMDISGLGRHGTIKGNLTPMEDRFGNEAGAFYFDKTARIDLWGNGVIAPPRISVGAWFKREGGTSVLGATSHGFSLHLTSAGTIQVFFDVYGSEHRAHTFMTESRNYNDGGWHYVVLTYDGLKVSVYIDAEKVGQKILAEPSNFMSGHKMHIGWRDGYFQGGIDDVRYYNRALSQGEITELYSGELGASKVPFPNAWLRDSGSRLFYERGDVYIKNNDDEKTSNLTVAGKIEAREVKISVDAGEPIPDYVFRKDYALRTLDELKAYVDKHEHLPEVPSEAKIRKDGISSASFQLLLLKKIEELTLYAIEQEKDNKAQAEEIKALRTEGERVDRLEAELEALKEVVRSMAKSNIPKAKE